MAVQLRRGQQPIAWAVLLTTLWLALAGVWGSIALPKSLPVVTMAQQLHDEATEHAKHCRCLDCSGGKVCCCLKSKRTGDRFVLRAACDNATALAMATSAAPALAPTRISAILPLLVPVLPLFVPSIATTPTLRAPSPLAPPPRFLS